MTRNLNEFLADIANQKYATEKGTQIHARLSQIIIDDTNGDYGDPDIVKAIRQHPHLHKYFSKNARTEVAIAGTLNGVFVSRRIDRLIINQDTHQIDFIDYKTDVNKGMFIDKYIKQLSEYARLLQSAYPKYRIIGYILWTHDWQVQQIISL